MNGNTSFELEIEPGDEIGTIIVIQKDGVDGGSFPMITGQTQWWIGRSPESDIQLKVRFFFLSSKVKDKPRKRASLTGTVALSSTMTS